MGAKSVIVKFKPLVPDEQKQALLVEVIGTNFLLDVRPLLSRRAEGELVSLFVVELSESANEAQIASTLAATDSVEYAHPPPSRTQSD